MKTFLDTLEETCQENLKISWTDAQQQIIYQSVDRLLEVASKKYACEVATDALERASDKVSDCGSIITATALILYTEIITP